MTKKFVVEQKRLISILSAMQPICGKRTTLDITNSIVFEVGHKELVLKSTDLEISLQSSCSIKTGSVEEETRFLVSGKRIFDLVKEMDGEVQFELKKSQLLLKNNKVKLSLNIKEAEEFPPFPERIENLMQLDSKFLVDMINKVSFLIPQNNSNPALNGLLLEFSDSFLTMTATDGHCLAQIKTDKYKLEESKSWLIPRRGIFEIKKILESTEEESVFLGVCSNLLVFSGESFNFFTKLLAYPFPTYSTILNKEDFLPAKVDRNVLLKTLRRSSCLLSGQFIATHFNFNESILKVSMQNKEVGELEEELFLDEFNGEGLDIRFYSPYLLNGLQVFSEDKIQFYLKNQYKPVIFEMDNPEYHLKYLVMPVSPTNT